MKTTEHKHTIPPPTSFGMDQSILQTARVEQARWETPLKFDPRVHIPQHQRHLIVINAPGHLSNFPWRENPDNLPLKSSDIYVMLTLANLLGEGLAISPEELVKRRDEEVVYMKTRVDTRRDNREDKDNPTTFIWAKQLLGSLFPQNEYNEKYSFDHMTKTKRGLMAMFALRIMHSGEPMGDFAKNFFYLSPDPENSLWEKTKEELIEYNNALIRSDNATNVHNFAMSFAYAKLFFPERFSRNIQITDMEWDAMRRLLDELGSEHDLDLYPWIALYMTILATEDVGIARNGQIFINLPPLVKVGGEKAEAMPEMLEVTS